MSINKKNSNEHFNWAENEFRAVNIGDKRLDKRLIMIAENFMNNPNAQIPQAMGNFGKAKGAYRFFDNKKVTANKIFNSHYKATKDRLNGKNIVLAIQDTTDLNYSHHTSVTNLGPAGTDVEKGFMLHPTLAVTPEGIPLGLIDFNLWIRDEEPKKGNHHNLPIEDKESFKWINSYRKTAQLEKQLNNVHFINICDREGDIFYLFNEVRKPENRSDLLIRAAQDRKVEHSQKKLWDYMESQEIKTQITIKISKKKNQPERDADISIRYAEVCIKAPKNSKKDKLSDSINLWAVYAKEKNPPAGVEAISWMLLTTIPVNNIDEALEKIEWYTLRWVIELFFKCLKSGCKVEDRQLKDAERLENCIVLDAIIAWRVMFLTYIGRDLPDLPASVMFEEYEWKSLYSYINKTPKVPEKEPALGEVVNMIAKLGGFLGRKNDKHPGMKTLWNGLIALNYISTTWKIFNTKKKY